MQVDNKWTVTNYHHQMCYTNYSVQISDASKDVYSDVLVNLAWVLIVAMADYITQHAWLELTTSFILTIMALRVAILLRKKTI